MSFFGLTYGMHEKYQNHHIFTTTCVHDLAKINNIPLDRLFSA